MKYNLSEITDWFIESDKPEANIAFASGLPLKASNIIGASNIAASLSNQCLERYNLNNEEEDFFLKDKKTTKQYRVHVVHSINGVSFELRVVKKPADTLSELGFPKSLVSALSIKSLSSGGLVVLVGNPGAGKTTTAAALITSRLKKYGGFCLTVENPVEIPLHGWIGEEGYCVQTNVSKGGFSDALSGAMRSYPVVKNQILFVGEVRDAETAHMLLNYAGAGYLVVTTTHGKSIIDGLQRIVELASGRSGDAALVMSNVLQIAVYQKLNEKGLEKVDALTKGAQVSVHIKNSDWKKLGTNIEQTGYRMKNDQIIFK